jgi:hypothetical protein
MARIGKKLFVFSGSKVNKVPFSVNFKLPDIRLFGPEIRITFPKEFIFIILRSVSTNKLCKPLIISQPRKLTKILTHSVSTE